MNAQLLELEVLVWTASHSNLEFNFVMNMILDTRLNIGGYV